jgi:hypothetical protein
MRRVSPRRVLAAAVITGGLLAIAWRPASIAAGPAWSEIPWPHPLDPWPAGRAFTCPAARCGAEVRIAIRPKIGFCNCSTGVATDDEIDRVGDLVVLGPDYVPDGPGLAVQIGNLVGRARRYLVKASGGRRVHAVALAVAAHCDVVVGTIDSNGPMTPKIENAAFEFLAAEPLRSWAENAVGGL